MASTSHHLADFAIITALPEERDAVLSAFPELTELREDSPVYYRAHLPLNGKTSGGYTVVLTSLLKMGIVDAALATEKMIARWNPRHILMVGIAGSLHRNIGLGDVVASTDVLYYDPGKATDEGTRYRPQGFPANARLLSGVQALSARKAEFSAWQGECDRRAKALAKASAKAKPAVKTRAKPKPKAKAAALPKPKLHTGTIASGSLVVASRQKHQELSTLHGKLFAAEMEIGGVMSAVFSHADPTRCITIRGISDPADATKSKLDDDDIYRQIAADNAAGLTRLFLQGQPEVPLGIDLFDAGLRLASAHAARQELRAVRGGSHLAFPGAVRPSGPLAELFLRLDVTDRNGDPLKIVQAVVRYVHADGRQMRDELSVDGSNSSVVSLRSLGPYPVDIFVVTAGAAARATLSARTPVTKKRVVWTP